MPELEHERTPMLKDLDSQEHKSKSAEHEEMSLEHHHKRLERIEKHLGMHKKKKSKEEGMYERERH